MLGEGSFSRVYEASDRLTGEEIAVKIIKREHLNVEDVDLLRTEAEIL
jgi:serine/threonine protein kinase